MINSFASVFEALEAIAWLAPLFDYIIFENSLGEYLTILLLVALLYLLAKVLAHLIERHAKSFATETENRLDDVVIALFHRSITFILMLGTFFFGVKYLDFPPIVDEYTMRAVFIFVTLKVAREMEFFVEYLIDSYLRPMAMRQKGMTKTFLPPIARLNKFIIWSLAILLIISNLGYNITSLVAGLGIGGLAIALAAQEALANVIGSLSILTDQPFKVGDWVKVEGYEGTIVEIGLRSTKIKTINKTVVSVPNKTVAGGIVENTSKRDMIHVDQVLDFSYGTSLKSLQELLKALEQLIRRDKDTDKDSLRVNFLEFGESSLKVKVFYNIRTTDFAHSLVVRQRINLKIKEKVERLGAEMAFPTRSLFIQNADNKHKTGVPRKANR